MVLSEFCEVIKLDGKVETDSTLAYDKILE